MTDESIRPLRHISERQQIYFVQAVRLGLVKIGTANDAVARLREISLVSPDRLKVLGFTLCWNSGRREQEIHAMFAAERQHGEWFTPSERLLQFIEEETWMNSKAFVAQMQASCDDPRRSRGRKPKPRRNDSATDAVNIYVKRASESEAEKAKSSTK